MYKRIPALFYKKSRIIALVLIGINIILNAWTVFHKDIIYNSDIARDFLLFNEITQKKIILIGPRADGIQGLFHGPLWLYLNYPAYIIGHGNPLVVGWFWFFLTLIFLLVSFIIATKLFNKSVGILYVTLLSSVMIYHSNGLFNPDGAMFLLPLFLFFFSSYYKFKRLSYLAISLLLVGLMIQFQMAIGIPFLILSTLLTLYLIIRNRKYFHTLAFLIVLLPLSTFILFDLRHNFEQLHSIINSFSGHTSAPQFSFYNRLSNRIELMTFQLFFFQGQLSALNLLLSYIIAFFLGKRISAKADQYRYLYLLFIYFYLGFYTISLLQNGNLLSFFIYPLLTLLFLLFSSNLLYHEKKFFIALIIIIPILQLISSISYISETTNNINRVDTSWQFQHNIALKIFTSNDTSFGYLIYAPDVFGYKQKYAYEYTKSEYPNKNATLFQKQRITYVVVEPIPSSRTDLAHDYDNWKKDKVTFEGKLLSSYTYPNSYKIEKYLLTGKEIAAPIDPALLDIIHFR